MPRPSYDSEAFGRTSESVARFIGSARFLLMQSVIVLLWIAYNGWTSYNYFVRGDGPPPFDRYPFILLNLVFSTQAAYAAPLILLAQTRQADRDKVQAEADRAANTRSAADTEFLAREVASLRLALGEVATRDFVRSELRDVLEEIRSYSGMDSGATDRSRKRKNKRERGGAQRADGGQGPTEESQARPLTEPLHVPDASQA